MEISGKVFFITGGAQGIGKGMAEAVLNKGGKVFLADVNSEKGEETVKAFTEKYGAEKAKFGKCDVTNKEQFTATFQSAVTNFGQIDVMVNNAGIMKENLWEMQIKINLNGVILGTNLALEHMNRVKGGKGGVIINTSSVVGLIPWFWTPIYASTKHAVVGFTQSLAKNPAISSMGVRLACLCPSAVDTNLVDVKADECLDLDSLVACIDFMGRLSVSTVAEAFLKLVEDEENNGKLMAVTPKFGSFYTERQLEPPLGLPTAMPTKPSE